MAKRRSQIRKMPGENYATAVMRRQAEAAREMCHNAGADSIQRYMWLSCVALNQEFGFGCNRWRRYLVALQDVSDEFTAMVESSGAEYAVEKLRQRVKAISEMDVEANADLRRRGEIGRRVL